MTPCDQSMLAPTRLAKCSMDKQAQSCFVKTKTVNNEMFYVKFVVAVMIKFVKAMLKLFMAYKTTRKPCKYGSCR